MNNNIINISNGNQGMMSDQCRYVSRGMIRTSEEMRWRQSWAWADEKVQWQWMIPWIVLFRYENWSLLSCPSDLWLHDNKSCYQRQLNPRSPFLPTFFGTFCCIILENMYFTYLDYLRSIYGYFKLFFSKWSWRWKKRSREKKGSEYFFMPCHRGFQYASCQCDISSTWR